MIAEPHRMPENAIGDLTVVNSGGRLSLQGVPAAHFYAAIIH